MAAQNAVQQTLVRNVILMVIIIKEYSVINVPMYILSAHYVLALIHVPLVMSVFMSPVAHLVNPALPWIQTVEIALNAITLIVAQNVQQVSIIKELLVKHVVMSILNVPYVQIQLHAVNVVKAITYQELLVKPVQVG